MVEFRKGWELHSIVFQRRLIGLKNLLDLIGKGHFHVVHKIDITFPCATHYPRIELLFVTDGRVHIPPVIMGGEYQSIVRQRKEFLRDGIKLVPRVATGGIRPTRAPRQ